MCEDCENLTAWHASYAEKHKLIRARWQPKRQGREFAGEAVSARLQRAGDLDLADEPRSTCRASP
jgi:hypothetical protein